MTPEERLAALETRVFGLESWLKSIDDKLDTVVAAMNMGKGAWILLLKVGAVLAAIVGASAWIVDHLRFAFK